MAESFKTVHGVGSDGKSPMVACFAREEPGILQTGGSPNSDKLG